MTGNMFVNMMSGGFVSSQLISITKLLFVCDCCFGFFELSNDTIEKVYLVVLHLVLCLYYYTVLLI